MADDDEQVPWPQPAAAAAAEAAAPPPPEAATPEWRKSPSAPDLKLLEAAGRRPALMATTLEELADAYASGSAAGLHDSAAAGGGGVGGPSPQGGRGVLSHQRWGKGGGGTNSLSGHGGHLAPTPADRRQHKLLRFSAAARVEGGGGWMAVVDPRSVWMRNWDLVVFVLLMFTCMVTPFEVAFVRAQPSSSVLFAINRCVDCLFAADVAVNFRLMYFDEETQVWVANPWSVARRYAGGMASLDIVSTVPYDVFVSLAQPHLGDVGPLRAVRALRLIKLLRVLRSSRIMARLQDQFFIHDSYLKLAYFGISTLVLCHWMACLLYLVRAINPAHCNWASAYFTQQHGFVRDGCSDAPELPSQVTATD